MGAIKGWAKAEPTSIVCQASLKMNSFTAIFVVTVAAVVAEVSATWPPSFCRGNDCPKFTILNTTEKFEIRKYEASRWASTSVSNLHDLNGAMRTGFMRLFNYISGNNERGQKIAMTCPVRTKIVPGSGPYCEDTFTISFMVPFAVETAPKPKDSTVFLEENPESVEYVSTFGGYASNDDWTNCLHDLTAAVNGLPVKTDHWYTAGYDSPLQFWNRHNECWLTQ